MASTTFGGHTYTQVDTTLAADVTAKIDELSGRQGDNMRPAYLQLVHTAGGVTSAWNLGSYSVQLGGKDSAGKIKLTNTATIMNAAKGLVLIKIPAAFYQAVGDYQSAFIRIMNGDDVVSTVSVAFSVFENTLAISSGDSITYLGSLEDKIKQAQALIDPINIQVKAIQSTLSAVQSAAKSYLDEVASQALAKTKSGNEFTEWNTFDQGITVKGRVEADSLGEAYGAWKQITGYVDGKFVDTGTKSNSGITFLNGNYSDNGLQVRHVRLGSLNLLFISGAMRFHNGFAELWHQYDLFKVGDLANVQNAMILKPLEVADGDMTLWIRLNGQTVTATPVGSKTITSKDWYFNLGQIFIW
ncbi:BppU family phage baseplate upper protein [Limosilactobacillus fermentum]|uniref:BppU family phage baseplate upper protein n=1 Tax=Limosilactobacillus fermentum TaxID=1613 RepID=UPI0025711AB7|nr:BppU family phage baseplate upper protein [Limosilactobacillus fermentum]WJD84210.1 BppU family phage baseplate upper protein [Limosilactobacillus fermentum]